MVVMETSMQGGRKWNNVGEDAQIPLPMESMFWKCGVEHASYTLKNNWENSPWKFPPYKNIGW